MTSSLSLRDSARDFAPDFAAGELAPLESAASHLIFRFEGALYAIESLAVREVLLRPTITPLHELSPLFLGVTHLRDQFLPVADLSRCLKTAATAAFAPPKFDAADFAAAIPAVQAVQEDGFEDVLIVLQREGAVVGIVVSQVCDVRPIERAAIFGKAISNSTTESAAEPAASCIAGVTRVDGQNLQLLFAPAIFELLSLRAPLLAPLLAVEPAQTGRDQDEAAPLVAVVRWGDERFGIAAQWIGEFAPLRAVTPVPRCPTSVLGLMNLRGEVLTLLDIRGALGLSTRPAAPDSSTARQIVVVECDDWRVGLVVDEVIDMFGLPLSEISPSGGERSSERGEVLSGTAWFESQPLGLLDVPAVLAAERRQMGEL